jgi:hypothetical protein
MPKSTSSTIEIEEASLTDSIAASGTEALGSVEGGITSITGGIWELFHEHPNVGGALSGGVGLAAAMTLGVAEVAAAVAAGYLGYRIFAYGESFTEAVEKAIEFKEGKLPEDQL